MANVFVEYDPKNDDYRAIQNKRVIVRGPTQLDAGQAAHDLRPNDPILAERQRHTSQGFPMNGGICLARNENPDFSSGQHES